MPVSIDSNASSAYYNEEAALKVPGTGKWYPLEPNSFSNFGGDLKTVARAPITHTRQRNKGTVTDLDVTAGWNEDFTQNNLTRLLQGFLYASARQKATTAPLYLTTGAAAISVVVGGFHRATGSFITDGFKVGHIIKSLKFGTPANNFLFVVSAVTATDITCAPVTNLGHYNDAGVATHETTALVAEAAGAGGIVIAVGIQLPTTAVLSGVNGATAQVKLDNTGGIDMTTLGLVVGEYLYIGDVSGTGVTSFNFIDSVTNTIIYRGWVRIASITATAIMCDVSILENFGTGAATATATNKVNVYFGNVIMNEQASLIVRRTYSILRTLGKDVTNANIYELIKGAVPNQFTMNIPSNNKLAADMDFVGMDVTPGVGTPVGFSAATPWNEAAYNTSSDVCAMLLYKIDLSQPEQAPLFGYATDEKLTINNNVAANKAIGVVGGFEAAVGSFDVSGSLTCYFDDERAISAIRNNANVGLLNIFAKQRQGMIWDLPLLTLGGGLLKVEKDKPITTDITHMAAAGTAGYTVLYNQFEALPDSAMAAYTPVNF